MVGEEGEGRLVVGSVLYSLCLGTVHGELKLEGFMGGDFCAVNGCLNIFVLPPLSFSSTLKSTIEPFSLRVNVNGLRLLFDLPFLVGLFLGLEDVLDPF